MAGVKQDVLQAFNQHLGRHVGLWFPQGRLEDLRKGLTRAALDLGYSDESELINIFGRLPLTAGQVQALARYLSVGETYFFRDMQIFQTLERNLLSRISRERTGGQRRLRMWSAGCCTGEEAYSLAISVQSTIPDWRDWDVHVVGTDINMDYLAKAALGIYGKWSFRETDVLFQQKYFGRAENGSWQVCQKLRDIVTFEYCNLADGNSPVFQGQKEKYDVIFCRNVLMYFSLRQATEVMRRLCMCLSPGGWLVLGPSEPDLKPGSEIVTGAFPGLRIYRRMGPGEKVESKPVSQQKISQVRETYRVSLSGESETRYVSLNPKISFQGITPEKANEKNPENADKLVKLGRMLSNSGKLEQALRIYDEAIELNKLNPVSHYLRGVVLQAIGNHKESIQAFRQVLYLDPDFVMAYFAMGNTERMTGNMGEAMKCFGNAQSIARQYPLDLILRESDGLTAGRLVQIIDVMQNRLA